MAALVAGALAQLGGRPAMFAAAMADRFGKAGPVIAAAGLVLLAASTTACIGGMLLAGMLTPEAEQLFLALALVLQGAAGLLPMRSPERLDGWRLGAFGTSFAGLFMPLFGDGLQLVVVALAARSELPYAAAVGATLGAVALVTPAALLGERGWSALPQAALRRSASLLFLVTGGLMAFAALRLI